MGHHHHQSSRSKMKAVALALTLLLALGCHVNSIQADAPSQLEHYKAAAIVYLNQVKDQAYKALENLEGTDYEQYKLRVTESLDNLQQYADSTSTSLKPYANQLMEATLKVREHIMAEMKDLNTRVAPHRDELRSVVEKHLEDYRTRLVPIFSEFMGGDQQDLNALRQKLQPAIEELRQKLESNFEETKSKVVPYVEAVRGKLTEQLLDLKNLATPVAAEYKEQILKAIEEVRGKLSTEELQGQLEPYMETLRDRFMTIYQNAAEALNQA